MYADLHLRSNSPNLMFAKYTAYSIVYKWNHLQINNLYMGNKNIIYYRTF